MIKVIAIIATCWNYGGFYDSGDNDDNVLDDDILDHNTLKLRYNNEDKNK